MDLPWARLLLRRLLNSCEGDQDPRTFLAGVAVGVLGLNGEEVRVLSVPQFYQRLELSPVKDMFLERVRRILGGRTEGLLLQRKKSRGPEKDASTPVNRMTLWRILKGVVESGLSRVLLQLRALYKVLTAPRPEKAIPTERAPQIKSVSAKRVQVISTFMRMRVTRWRDPVSGKEYKTEDGPD